jgi:hypothetical protein
MSTTFPVFGEGGLEGDLVKEHTPTSPTLPQTLRPSMEYSDPARNAAELDARFHAIAMLYAPELTKAQDAKRLAEIAVQQWTQVCREQWAAVTRLQDLTLRGSLSLQHEDDEPGTRQQRLRAATAALRESQGQLETARATLIAAKEKIQSLTGTP